MSAIELLKAPNTSAVALYKAANAVLGDFLDWEPESIWLELGYHGVDIPDPSRAKLMAALTLRLVPGFYWDAIVFEKTAIALDGHFPHPDILEEATPAQLAWAVEEAAWILRIVGDAALEFQHEPRAYAGVVLARAGFVLAPAQLGFAQSALDRETQASKLRDDVAERWSRVSKDHLEQLSLDESHVDVQIARLAAVELHVRDRRRAAEQELSRL